MKFTEEDIPLMKFIFNPSTHDMGMMVGRERANEIWNFVSNKLHRDKEDFVSDVSDFYEWILRDEDICDFFWDNNILQISLLNGWDISFIFRKSPIVNKIWNIGKLDLDKLDEDNIYWLLKDSPIAKKIWDSGKLNISLLNEEDLEKFKKKFR